MFWPRVIFLFLFLRMLERVAVTSRKGSGTPSAGVRCSVWHDRFVWFRTACLQERWLLGTSSLSFSSTVFVCLVVGCTSRKISLKTCLDPFWIQMDPTWSQETFMTWSRSCTFVVTHLTFSWPSAGGQNYSKGPRLLNIDTSRNFWCFKVRRTGPFWHFGLLFPLSILPLSGARPHLGSAGRWEPTWGAPFFAGISWIHLEAKDSRVGVFVELVFAPLPVACRFQLPRCNGAVCISGLACVTPVVHRAGTGQVQEHSGQVQKFYIMLKRGFMTWIFSSEG